MIVISIILLSSLTMIISEIMGKGEPLYSRIPSFILIHLVNISIYAFIFFYFYYDQFFIVYDVIFSSLFILFAWFGLRNHLSNSITIALLLIINDCKGISYIDLVKKYDVRLSTENRLNQLVNAGYLDNSLEIRNSIKSKIILKIIKYLYR